MSFPAFLQFLKDAENKGSLNFYEELPLSGVSAVGTGGAADFFVLPENIPALISTLRAAVKNGVPYLTVGNSSNLFYHDSGFRGAIVCTKRLSGATFENGYIYAECGCMMPVLSELAKQNGLSGFEGICSVPGTVGGGLCLNASAFGQSISDRLVSFTVYLPEKDAVAERTKEDGAFLYRESKAADGGAVILSAVFKGIPETKRIVSERMEKNREKRKLSQPSGARSAGSFYKRPGEGISAGELIDRCGLKGASVGGARVSEKHANFFINTGGARTADFAALSDKVGKAVFEKTGMVLEKEVLFINERTDEK